MIARRVRSTASIQFLMDITISSQMIKFACQMSDESFESIEILQTLSEKQEIGILNTERAVILLSKSDAATVDVVTAIIFYPRNFRID